MPGSCRREPMTTGRPPVILAEKRPRIVMAILSGEVPIADSARREKVSEQWIGRWRRNSSRSEVSWGGGFSGLVDTGLMPS